MKQVRVKERNSEVLIVLDGGYESELDALKEAFKLLGREVIRHELGIDPRHNRPIDSY